MTEPATIRVAAAALRGARTQRATVTTLRERNRAKVLTQVVRAGRTTRSEIAAACGLSPASATNLVGDLIAEGLVMESGSISSRGGRPIAVLERRPEGAYLVGADVGERGVAVELFDFAMNRLDREFRGGREEEDPETIGHDLSDAISALERRNPEPWTRLAGIGLALPGIVETDLQGRQVLYAQSLGWPPVAIDDLVPSSSVPVFAENGAKTQAKAEQWFGAARGVEHAVVALLGRGVGLGVVSDGVLQRGSAGSASEWGHVKIARDGRRCRCGASGCVEAYVGGDAILAAWAAAGGTFEGSGWRALGQLLESSDPAARRVVDDVVETLGMALGSLVSLTGPEKVVVGGWVGLRLMESLAARIEEAIRANALERPGSQFTLVPATFGGDTVALGAAIMPLEALISG